MAVNNQTKLYFYCQKLKSEEKKYSIAVKKLQETIKILKTDQNGTKKQDPRIYQNLLEYNKTTQNIIKNKIQFAQRGLQLTTFLIKNLATKEFHRELPLWDGQPIPLCGKIPCQKEYIGSVGDLVAASIVINGQKSIILCHVKSFNQQTETYQLADYFQDLNKPPTYYLKIVKQNVIPLPSSLSTLHHPQTEFEKGDHVLAVYPNTTTFYPAQVISSPGSRSNGGNPTFNYLLHFTNDTVEQQEIYSRFVLPMFIN
ncbi:hypothetical protein M0812_26218 [Anaeramoeba flamelloides]|uniref:SGF29 C-terminal domain-containing protein n=1 Tax=Anaeramoeba flamelloides TaxID=1746091 RepID=A0AAV7YCM3_9EUKA|nr:hypothetical protein M0812_26218 [Anaeramoeba flamelloides]